jgi:hypothetical protein
MEPKSPIVLDTHEVDWVMHPAERTLSRYVSNEMGTRRKRLVVRHLEACQNCQKSVARLRVLSRTFRDWERTAIMQAAPQGSGHQEKASSSHTPARRPLTPTLDH